MRALLTSSQGIVGPGVVLPADPDTGDDVGVHAAVAPPALFVDAGSPGVYWWW